MIEIESLELKSGSHDSPEAGMCLMEAVAYFAGEPHSWKPKCVDPAFNFLVTVNDRLSDESRQKLKPYIRRLAGTKGTAEHEAIRRAMLSTWAFKITAQRAEDAGLLELAVAFRALPEVTKENVKDVRKQLASLRSMAWAERVKHRSILAEKIKVEIAKRGLPAAADAAAAAAAADAADAAADAAAAADADAADADAADAADAAAAVAVAADAAVAVAAVAADAAAAVAVADVADVAVAAAAAWRPYGDRWLAVHSAVYSKLLQIYKARYAKYDEANLASLFELLDKMIAVHHVAIEAKR